MLDTLAQLYDQITFPQLLDLHLPQLLNVHLPLAAVGSPSPSCRMLTSQKLMDLHRPPAAESSPSASSEPH